MVKGYMQEVNVFFREHRRRTPLVDNISSILFGSSKSILKLNSSLGNADTNFAEFAIDLGDQQRWLGL